MKTRFNLNLQLLFTIVLFLTFNSKLHAQENQPSELKEFKIKVEKTDNTIRMTCNKGCAWTELTSSTNNFEPQAIDEYGMTELKEVSPNIDPNLSDFLFTITKTENEVSLTGIEGTAWTNLNFSLAKNKKQDINQLGMTK